MLEIIINDKIKIKGNKTVSFILLKLFCLSKSWFIRENLSFKITCIFFLSSIFLECISKV